MSIIGSTIEGYLIEEAIGSGSFGAVYKVSKFNNIYAAKIFADTYVLAEFQKDQNRITREIDALKQAHGNHLIQYIDDFSYINAFGVTQHVIIMEYFDGITLRKFMENNNTNIDTLLNIFNDILSGVEELHNSLIEENSIIHRDLKPENIMIDENNSIKIIDYGLSKLIDFSTITSTGRQIGSPLYMPPEQIEDSKNIDYRADIYALGIILYEMLTGEIPYRASTMPELLMKILNSPIIPPRQFNPDISEHIEHVIIKATSKELFARYQRIDELEKALVTPYTEETFTFEGKFYAWVYKEKDVTEKFEKINSTDIIYPIHVKNWQKGLDKYFGDKNYENVIIDPSTQRLSYLAFGGTKGLVNLPYAPKEGVISLNYLNNPHNRYEYIGNWYDTVSAGNKLILPYHYISNTDYPVDKIEDWIKINLQLISDAKKVVDKDKKNYAMISIGLSHLVFQSEKILSFYRQADVDAFILQVSDLKQLNEQSLPSYLNFIDNLQKHTNKPVIALKVPISLGLTLIAKGIHGFSLGLAGIDYFDENYIKEEKDSYNLYSKYYFPQLMSFLSYPKKEPFAFNSLYSYFGACDCHWCNGKTAIEIAKGDKSIQLHHWQKMIDEVDKIKQQGADKIPYIKSRIDIALTNYVGIPTDILGSQKNSDYYKLLKNLKNVL